MRYPKPLDEDAEHKTYQALTIGNDVIVPATGVRGALRTLMTILTGGTLGYLNDDDFSRARQRCESWDHAARAVHRTRPPTSFWPKS